MIGLQVKNDLLSVSSQIAKRIMDIFGALVGLVILPDGVLVDHSNRPSHLSSGKDWKNGVVFDKFRTM